MALFSTEPALALPHAYGCVLLVLVLTLCVHHFYMAIGVSNARKKFGVKYPAIYAADGAPSAKEFNCIQRGHQNSLENLPQLLALLLVLGLRYPITAAIAGLVVNVGRIMYFAGYGTGNPSKRARGAMVFTPAMLTYYGMAVVWGIELLRSAQ